jgi:hypothetical protein
MMEDTERLKTQNNSSEESAMEDKERLEPELLEIQKK